MKYARFYYGTMANLLFMFKVENCTSGLSRGALEKDAAIEESFCSPLNSLYMCHNENELFIIIINFQQNLTINMG